MRQEEGEVQEKEGEGAASAEGEHGDLEPSPESGAVRVETEGTLASAGGCLRVAGVGGKGMGG